MGIKISALTSVGTPALSDVFPIVQSGVTYKESFTQLSSLFATAGANSNITSLSGITGIIKAPTFIDDVNDNHVLGFLTQPNPVNYVNITNSETGFPVIIQSRGTDLNIQIDVLSKGTAPVALGSAGLTGQLITFSGTAFQHTTNWNLPTSAATTEVTLPDYTGTFFLSSKANGTEAANAVTASGTSGVITTSALTTAGGASYAITWTNTFMAAASIIQLSVMGGTNNATENYSLKATAGVGTSTLTITNNTAATALNGTILIGYTVIP